MKIKSDTPAWTATYVINSEYGRLECTFYPEDTAGHFYNFFSTFAEDINDYLSVHPSFERYADHATNLFAKLFPDRLKQVLEDTVDEVRLNTLISINGIPRQEAAAAIKAALETSAKEKKKRMNAPSAGRPKKWTKKTLKKAVADAIADIPQRLNPTLDLVAQRLGSQSKEALRKDLKRHGLEWKELKKRT